LVALVPPFRSAVVFSVQNQVAVGRLGRGEHIEDDVVRDVLMPLTGPSALQRAAEWRMIASGDVSRPTTTERILFNLLKQDVPAALAVVPIVVDKEVRALLYVDLKKGPMTGELLNLARQAATKMAELVAGNLTS
jgi:hypothetical protein